MASSVKSIAVAVAVIMDAQSQVLLTQRAANAAQGGLWEFPGGKIEAGETVYQALCRELKEELNIDVTAATPFTKITHDYPEYSVTLDVWKIDHFNGEPFGAEGQPMQWLPLSQLPHIPLPAANQAIVDQLCPK